MNACHKRSRWEVDNQISNRQLLADKFIKDVFKTKSLASFLSI